MPRITTVQAAHTYGVLDPHVIERRDTKFIGGSLSDGCNIVLLPQGGYTDRGGTTDFGRVRRKLTPIAVTGAMLTMPNGGNKTDLLAGTATSTTAAAGARFVVFECDFGAPTLVHMIDVRAIRIATTAAAGALVAEYWNGAAWTGFGSPLRITLGAFSRRLVSGAPGHAGITANKFRIAIDGTLAAGAITLSGIAFHAESAALSDGIVRKYAPEQGKPHQLVITDRNIDVFEQGTWKGSVPLPTQVDQIRVTKLEPRLDTILAWHQDVRPQKITRMGSSTEWACDDLQFTNIPLVDYGATYTNGVNEVQEIKLYELGSGSQFELTCEGLTTEAITVDASAATTATRIKNALEALPNVETGLVVTGVDVSTFRVEFAGAGNQAKDWLTMVGTGLTLTGVVRIRTTIQGKRAGEPMISDARGWPAVGRYAQQRLIMAGLKSRPNDVLASVTGDPFNLSTDLNVATRAFSYEVDGSENSVIRDIVVARTLLFYGDQQLSFLKNKVLSANEVPEFGSSDTPGIKAETSPVSSDNAIFNIQAGGTTLRMTSYTELEQNFVSDNASVLSAHLIRDPSELFRRRARGAQDSDLLMMVNSDGTMTVLTMMRTQEVSGFAPWDTDGLFRSGCVDHGNDAWFLVERLVDGVAQLRLEKHEPKMLLDEAVELVQAASKVITGLSRFNGRTVYAVANDSVYGPHLVTGGQITVDEDVTSVRVGTWRAPYATDPDVSLTEETKTRMARLKRVNRAVLSVIASTSLAVRANDGPIFEISLRSNNETMLDVGPLSQPYTGKAEAEGMHGFTDHGRLTVTMPYPGFFTIRSLTKSVVA